MITYQLLIFTICILSLYCWSFDLAKIWHFTCETLKLFFSKQARACYYHGVWAAIGLYTMMDICLFQERAWCCSYAAPEWLEWRRGAVLLQLERLQVPGGGRSNRDGHLEDKQLCPGKKPLKVLKRNLSQTVKVQSFMCSYGRVPMVSEAFFCMQSCQCKGKI